jgi:uncharacterized protein YprB with RNaseH-like and TPR domain
VLQNTFCHIPVIGPVTERLLWDSNIATWDAALGRAQLPLSDQKTQLLRTHLRASVKALQKDDPSFFAGSLASSEHWRLFDAFRHTLAYIDIETTGLGNPHDIITTIALYDGNSVRHYVNGQNLGQFAHDIRQYKLIVTYNGKCFDVPFIRNYLRIPMSQAHIDLRYLLNGLGYRGGLKQCERQLGLDRKDLADVDGFFAVLLWQEFDRHRNQRALETLLAYNILDVLNLETLMIAAYNLRLSHTPFATSHRLPPSQLPENPFQADGKTVARLRRKYAWALLPGSPRWDRGPR